MVVVRLHQIRLAVIGPPSADQVQEVAASVVSAASDRWWVSPLSADIPGQFLIVIEVDATVGTPGYARSAHTLVQHLYDTGAFERVEADVPVHAYSQPETNLAVGIDDEPPGSESLQWARDAIRCGAAWRLPLPAGGRARGDGVRVGHPDTGYTDHWALGLSALDLTTDWDEISGDADAADPLVPAVHSPWPLPSPGHGTATASVIDGRGDDEHGVVGVAPLSRLVPVRAVESVVQFFDSDVAHAVDHARQVGCQVVSMSLGGKGFFGLRSAIDRAIQQGMIVMAAAGNVWPYVVAPASYDNCLGVAATGPDHVRWPLSAHGSAVDVSAPGWGVHVAGFGWDTAPPTRLVARSSGTSYSVAHLAGVAALWLSFHGWQSLVDRYGAPRLQSVFVHLLRTDGVLVPGGWDLDWGAGVVDAEAMLQAPLPEPSEVPADVRPRGGSDDPVSRLAALTGTDVTVMGMALARTFGRADTDLTQLLRRFEGEVAYHVIEHEPFRDALLAAGRAEAVTVTPLEAPVDASPHLRAALSVD